MVQTIHSTLVRHLTFTGGTGIDTTVSDDEITYAIDSTVATLTGSSGAVSKQDTDCTSN